MTSQNVVPQSDVTTWFDFWLGKWDVSWDEGEGARGSGTNTITRILEGNVIQEDFVITDGQQKGFKGMSLSVYGAGSNQWHQAWVDNQGGFFNLVGERNGDVRTFKTLPRISEGKEIVQRMVFKDIAQATFVWDWEKSEDGGSTWTLDWRIDYRRAFDPRSASGV